MKQKQTKRPANPTLIATHDALASMCDLLRARPLLALDTESDSLYSYYPKVCLIQITTFARADSTDPRAVVDFLVDPLRLTRLDKLGQLLADPHLEVIMHAAENDILTLQRDFAFTFHNIFDTQLAARILGWPRVGLASLLEEHFGLISNKRMQRTNWGKRPLTPQQISYAQMDTHYLPALRALLITELRAMGRLEEAHDAFAQLATLDYRNRPVNTRTVWSMRNVRKVPDKDLAVLHALWEWREQEAQHENRPPFKIAGDSALVRLADARPQTLDQLVQSDALSKRQTHQYGTSIVKAIREGLAHPRPTPPVTNHRPEAALSGKVQRRFEALRHWRTKKAKDRGVDSDIVLTNSTLLNIAQQTPRTVDELARIDDVGPWKAQHYGPEILAILTRKP